MGSIKKKKMCKLKKKLKDDTIRYEAFAAMVCEPAYFCRKCGRVAQHKKQLCKPVAMEDYL